MLLVSAVVALSSCGTQRDRCPGVGHQSVTDGAETQVA